MTGVDLFVDGGAAQISRPVVTSPLPFMADGLATPSQNSLKHLAFSSQFLGTG